MKRLTEADEGKAVVDGNGERVGMISGVTDDGAYVDPKPNLTDRIRAKLGWENVEEDDYLLDQETIDEVTDSEVRLRK